MSNLKPRPDVEVIEQISRVTNKKELQDYEKELKQEIIRMRKEAQEASNKLERYVPAIERFSFYYNAVKKRLQVL